MIRGIGVSEGVVIAKALTKKEREINITLNVIVDVEAEIDRLSNAVYKYSNQLETTYKKTLNVMGEEEASTYKNHLNILKDSVVIGGVKKQIRDKSINAEYVLDEVKRKYEAIFNRMEDDFLRKKAEYIKNITEGIIKLLMNEDASIFDKLEEPVIIVAEDLMASDTLEIDKEKVLGMVLENPNKTSHGALLAKSWKIPLIVGVKKLLETVKDGDLLIVDGKKGEITINPDEESLQFYRERLDREKELDQVYHTYIDKETKTLDDYPLELEAMVSMPDEVRYAVRNGADNIGLYRTEALFISRGTMPSEHEQYSVYKEAVDYAKGKEICFRTFDCHGKSDLPYIHLPDENNPAMGYFSTRIALTNRELLLTQIKAILRASAYGHVKFVVPMVSSIDELLDIKLLIEDAKLLLDDDGIAYDNQIEFGVVLETPSVAIITSFFAQEVDFIYVDVDDMLQYMTGTDPTNEMVFELYDEYHPGFLRLLKSMVRSAHREGTWLCFSGNLCLNELLIPIFIAMGVDRLCIPYREIPQIRWEINSTDKKTWEKIQDDLQRMPSGKQIKSHLEKCYGNEYIWKK